MSQNYGGKRSWNAHSPRIDRGEEFNSAEFNDFCKQHGVKRQLTTAYTPQQNGIAERKNHTMMNMVGAVLTEKKVPKKF